MKRILPTLLLPLLGAISPQTIPAQITAITTTLIDGGGYIDAGAAFCFTPTTNLDVTSVGYEAFPDALAPIVSIWSDTNFVIASYHLPPHTNTAVGMEFTNVSLTLLAGRRYSIVAQNGSLSENNPLVIYGYVIPHFQAAPQLTNYAAARFTRSGEFADFTTNTFYLGPNFTFTVRSAPVIAPELRIAHNDETVTLSWQALPGFLLQRNSSLTTGSWSYVSNGPTVVNGTNEVTLSSGTSNEFFRLILP